MTKKLIVSFAICLVMMGMVTMTHATPAPGVDSWAGANFFIGDGNFHDYMIGFQFSVNEDLNVTALGSYDHGIDGLEKETYVGLWNEDGVLLGSVTVPQFGNLIGNFRYANLDRSITLKAGTKYRIGASVRSTTWLYETKGISTSPKINYLYGTWSFGQGNFPLHINNRHLNNNDGSNDYISANFLSETTSIP